MKKYQIGNLTVEADSPVKALEIAKLFTKDSYIVDGVEKFYWNDVRQMCIRHNWYTHGDCAAYDRMLNAASNGQWTIDEIAFDIANHSDSSVSKAEVLAELKKIKLTDSIKDADSLITETINLTKQCEEARKNAWSKDARYKDLLKKAFIRAGENSDSPFINSKLTEKIYKEYDLKSAVAKINELRGANSNEINRLYEEYKNTYNEIKNLDKILQSKLYELENKYKIKFEHKNVYMSTDMPNLRRELNNLNKSLGDSVKDDDIDYLSKEEEKAIADYKRAIANTKDPKLLRLFAHILNEEIEHLEELQSEAVGDSIKDSKYAIYRKHDNHYLGNGARSWVKKGSNNIDVYNSKEEALKILRAYVDDYDAEIIEIR